MRRVLAAFFVVMLLAGGLTGAFVWYSYHAPLPLPSTPFDFEVRAGSSLAAVANQLQYAGVLAHPNALIALARMTRTDRAIKAGSYEVSQGITLRELLYKLTQGDVSQASITIVEGSNFADLRRALKDNPQITKTVVDLPDAQLLARLGASERSLEGLFFPDTYF